MQGGSVSSWSDGRGFLNAFTNDQTGLTQLGVRQYDASLGRFISVDPVLSPESPQQNNGFSYAANSPVTRSDPSGACWVSGNTGCASSQAAPSKSSSAAKPASKPAAKAAPAKKPQKAKKAAKPHEDWWNPFSWKATTWQDVGAVAAGVGAGLLVTAAIVGAVACTAATFGVCAAVIVGAAVVGGAAGAATTYALQSGKKSWQGLGTAVAYGAAGGVLGAGSGAIVSKVAGAVAPKIAAAVAARVAAKGGGAVAGKAASGAASGGAKASASSNSPSIGSILQSHVDSAAAKFDASPSTFLSAKEAASSRSNPALAPMFRGTHIDNLAKSSARLDPRVSDLWITGRGEYGPDFVDLKTNTWYDITTTKQFQSHLDKYSWGTGVGLFTP